MVADWNKPNLSSALSAVWGEVLDVAKSALKLNPSGDSNIPTNALNYNRTSMAIEEYNGSSFVDFLVKLQQVSGTGTNQGGAAAIAAAPITIVYGSASASNDGIIMPDLSSGSKRMVALIINASATALKVYPPSGGLFENGSANAPITVAIHSSVIVFNYFQNNFGKIVSA